MISTGQILTAGVITAVGVGASCWFWHWPARGLVMAAAMALVLIVGWRALSNALGLNGDFLPAVSVGDVGCLLSGAIGPAGVAASVPVPAERRWLPAIV